MPDDTPATPAEAGATRRTLARLSLALLVGAWGIVLLRTWAATAPGTRSRTVELTVSLAGLALAVLAARDGWSGTWSTWGWAVAGLQVLVGLAWVFPMGAAWGWWIALFAALAGPSVGLEGPALPEGLGHRLLLAGLAFLALAPIVDATLAGPAPEPEPRLQAGSSYEAGETERWSADAGAVRVSQTPLHSSELPDVDLVAIAVPADRDRLRLLETAFREGDPATYSFPMPFPPFVLVEQSEVSRHEGLPGGWEAASIGYEHSERFMGVFGAVEGERQNLLLRSTAETDSVRLVPPGAQTWDVLTGYRFHQEGNTSQALDVLANHTTVEGQPLVPPPGAEEHVRLSGEYTRSVPGPGWLAGLLGLALAAATRRRNR